MSYFKKLIENEEQPESENKSEFGDGVDNNEQENIDNDITDDTEYLPEDIQGVVVGLSNYLKSSLDEVVVASTKARVYFKKEGSVVNFNADDMSKILTSEKFSMVSYDTNRNTMFIQFDL